MDSGFHVLYKEALVGTLEADDEGRLAFRYSSEWTDSPMSFPISASLPLHGEWTPGREDHRWFANLLPEGAAREGLCRMYGISTANDAALLRKIGADCAGALRIVPEAQRNSETEGKGGYREIDIEDLEAITAGRKPIEQLHKEGLLRLSLAGAQDKWAVKWDGERLLLPFGGAPSTHIIKFPTGRVPGLAYNEAFVTRLAAECGLSTVDAEVLDSALLVSRYDRARSEDGSVRRIHQEDFCQVMGFASRVKYQSDGGPAISDCAEVIRKDHRQPGKDLLQLVRWQIFNVLAGNADGHAKNLSRLYDSPRGRLAPFYDLVCTAAYDGFSPLMAMSVGKVNEPGQIRRIDWDEMATNLGIRPGLIFREIDRIISTLTDRLDSAMSRTQSGERSEAPIARVRSVIKKRLRRIRTNL
jgi:serine/threonine-protein kinase HipA